MTPTEGPFSIDDVVDFYHQWPQLRLKALALTSNDAADATDRELLSWMIRIIDRIGPNDLRPDDRGTDEAPTGRTSN